MINGSGRQPYYEIAKREIGVREIVGPKHNPRVLQYHQATRLKAATDETAWCAAFVCWCLEQAGFTSTRSAAASSYCTWGQPCDVREDAIVVFGKHDPDAKGTGHVAIVDHLDPDGEHVWVLGGNQQNAVNVARRRIADIVASRWPLVS
jgi:uncharacterized protein (TIGR02594 family)